MSDIMDIIRNRRSVRVFQEKDISATTVHGVLEAVQWSPSWANTQCWEVVVVRNPEIKTELSKVLASKNPATRSVENAPVVLVLCGRLGESGYYKGEVTTKFGDWFMFDLGIACQSICLAAHDRGLGTVVVGLFDHNAAARLLKTPKGVEVVALIPMGYPARVPSPPARKAIEAFTHAETF